MIMVNVFVNPVQVTPKLVKVGVTVIVAVIGTDVVFTAVKEGMFPLPEAAKPIAAMLFVHVYPFAVPEKLTLAIGAPLHAVILSGWLTIGVGFTVKITC
jgi:hypothetical protein